MTAPLFSLPTDDDERAELAAVGVELTDADAPDAIDAAASENLRRMARIMADVERYEATLAREAAALRARYERRIAPLEAAYLALEAQVQALAQLADFGKRQSRTVGYGVYGKRSTPARVTVADAVALLEWARTAKPDGIQLEVRERVPSAVASEHFKATGEIPAGCEYVPAAVTYYAKPEPMTEAPGGGPTLAR